MLRSSEAQSHRLSSELPPSRSVDKPQGHAFPSFLMFLLFLFSDSFSPLSPGRQNKEKLIEKTRAQRTMPTASLGRWLNVVVLWLFLVTNNSILSTLLENYGMVQNVSVQAREKLSREGTKRQEFLLSHTSILKMSEGGG